MSSVLAHLEKQGLSDVEALQVDLDDARWIACDAHGNLTGANLPPDEVEILALTFLLPLPTARYTLTPLGQGKFVATNAAGESFRLFLEREDQPRRVVRGTGSSALLSVEHLPGPDATTGLLRLTWRDGTTEEVPFQLRIFRG